MLSAAAKGKGKAIEPVELSPTAPLSSGDSSSDSSDSSDQDSDEDDVATPEYLEQLLAAAKQNMATRAQAKLAGEANQDVLMLPDEKQDLPLPSLNPGPSLPQPYFTLGKERGDSSTLTHDPDIELAERAASTSALAISNTLPQPDAVSTKNGVKMTKREKKELKNETAGPKWFDLPAPSAADLPRLAREVEAMRLRNALDPKRFYRKEETRKGPLPKHFAIGHIITTPSPFGGVSRDNLPKAARKRTIVDELVDDDEARAYAKRKFNDLQAVRGERGRGTWKRKMDARKNKW